MKGESREIIYGIHSVTNLLRNAGRKIYKLYVTDHHRSSALQQLIELAQTRNLEVTTSSPQQLDQISDNGHHQGIVAECAPMTLADEFALPEILPTLSPYPFILVLDQIQDPHNLGACLRTADAAGVNLVIFPKDNNVGITPVVRKVASGAAESVPIVVATNLARALNMIKEAGVWCYGLDERATDSLYQTKLQGSIAIVMGAEGSGLRRLTRELCDFLIHIPMKGQVESLNVSVATGVVLYEVVRQTLV